MEFTSPALNTLKISTKKGYILVDPDTSEDAKIIILSDGSATDISQTKDNLVIYGPGDFEASGILVKGTRAEKDTTYSLDSGDGRALLVSSSSVESLTDEDDYDVVAVKAVGPVEESALASLSSKLVIVYGNEEFMPDALKAKKQNKINAKKIEETEGNVLYLEKK